MKMRAGLAQELIDQTNDSLTQRIPSMKTHGFVIRTNHGEIQIAPEHAAEIAGLVEKILLNQIYS